MNGKILRQADRVTYSETVKVNIGDYESRDVYIGYGTDLNDGESFDDALKRARREVRAALQKNELKIRRSSQEHVDFNTMAKLYGDEKVASKKHR